MTLFNDTITDSHASTGGGIYNGGGSSITAVDCTISGNSGGAGIANLGTLKLTSDTISGNAGNGILNVVGGGNHGSVFLHDTIIENNTGSDVSNSAGASVSSSGGNLYGTSFQTTWDSNGAYPDIQSSTPDLGTLQSNGGDTETVALQSGSPALGAGDPVLNTMAAGTATVASNAVSSVTLSSEGAFYASAPTVIFTGGGGSGAAATVTLIDGMVTAVTITSGGSGYTSAPRSLLWAALSRTPTSAASLGS